MERVLEINSLQAVTKAVVEAARASLRDWAGLESGAVGTHPV
jgi:hypothetical protein